MNLLKTSHFDALLFRSSFASADTAFLHHRRLEVLSFEVHVGGLGFEPRFDASKAPGLPLADSPI